MPGPFSNPYTLRQTARKHSAEQSELFQLHLGIKDLLLKIKVMNVYVEVEIAEQVV